VVNAGNAGGQGRCCRSGILKTSSRGRWMS